MDDCAGMQALECCGQRFICQRAFLVPKIEDILTLEFIYDPFSRS
jgi:hypothetical protein